MSARMPCAEHPADACFVIYDLDGCDVKRCGACGFSIEGGTTGKYCGCPFCGDWFIDDLDEEGTEVVCQGCGATAPADVWNRRADLTSRPAGGQHGA